MQSVSNDDFVRDAKEKFLYRRWLFKTDIFSELMMSKQPI